MNQNSNSNRRTPPSHGAREVYWWPITETKIRAAAQKIAAAMQPDKIILFGSCAHGKQTPDSDVDLLVILPSANEPHAITRELSELLYPRPFPIDILVRSSAEISERLQWRDCFISDIISNGRVLYERPSR